MFQLWESIERNLNIHLGLFYKQVGCMFFYEIRRRRGLSEKTDAKEKKG